MGRHTQRRPAFGILVVPDKNKNHRENKTLRSPRLKAHMVKYKHCQ